MIGLILAVQIEVCQSCENGRAQTEQSEEGDKVSLPECISGFQWCTQRKFTDTLEALKTTLVHKFSNTITRTYTYSPDGNVFADRYFQRVTAFLVIQYKPVKCREPLS